MKTFYICYSLSFIFFESLETPDYSNIFSDTNEANLCSENWTTTLYINSTKLHFYCEHHSLFLSWSSFFLSCKNGMVFISRLNNTVVWSIEEEPKNLSPAANFHLGRLYREWDHLRVLGSLLSLINDLLIMKDLCGCSIFFHWNLTDEKMDVRLFSVDFSNMWICSSSLEQLELEFQIEFQYFLLYFARDWIYYIFCNKYSKLAA